VRWGPGVEPAIRRPSPHLVFPREEPSIVPRPPPPDWTLEAPPPPPFTPRRNVATVEPWPTSLLTLPAPVYQPLDPTITSDRRRRRRLALGSYAVAVALASLALAFWQLYWMLESTETGRALLDGAAATVAAVADRF